MTLYLVPIYDLDKKECDATMYAIKARSETIARRKVYNQVRLTHRGREYIGEAERYKYQ